MPARTIAIGDVHGCNLALRKVIEMIAPTQEDTVVFLGDYVDRGPDSPGVIETVMALEERCKVVSLLGNHEIMLLSVHAGMDPQVWIQCGGGATLRSYGGAIEEIPEEHISFLRSCIPHWQDEKNIYVHASYMPNQDLAEMDEDVLFWEHLTNVLPLPHKSGKRVVVGHTPQVDCEVMDAGHLVCIDTYCFGSGHLTAFDVNTKEVWQADKNGDARGARVVRKIKPVGLRWLKRMLRKGEH